MRDEQVKVISEWYVRPETEVDVSKRHYNLGPSDVGRLLISYSQCALYFKKPTTFNPSIFLDNLKLLLSKLLVPFYPLAGQLVTLKYENENSCSIYVDCHKGPGAKLIHADALGLSLADVLSPKSDIPEVVQSFFDDVDPIQVINYDGHTKPLFSIQVTLLSDGVVLGVCQNHCLVDGIACHTIFKKWSEIYMELFSSPTNIINDNKDKNKNLSIVVDGKEGLMLKLPYVDFDHLVTRGHDNHTRERIFHFSSTSIASLKAQALAQVRAQTQTQASGSKISSLQALSAFMWRCITRARDLDSHQKTTCVVVADLRSRLDPPLPYEYFGNFLVPARVTIEVGELLASNIGSAASLLHQAVKGLNDKVPLEEYRTTVQQLVLPGLQSHGENPVLVGSSPWFDHYSLEFGLGRAVALHLGYQNMDGKISVHPGAKGDGSMDFHICLAPHAMTRLESDTEFMSIASFSNFLQN